MLLHQSDDLLQRCLLLDSGVISPCNPTRCAMAYVFDKVVNDRSPAPFGIASFTQTLELDTITIENLANAYPCLRF